ncbi:probable cardiolipin synthase (CMP-forming) [Coccinella septempunctata]|uniref:probable cardiolipin synthase (CMP-forming) n=1 Tax=Coccinella septempunctata TaxID=41139 RepID=UPI001D08CC5E|nr:probable cardiolipin synthase (CMP-forming) [Coccinella septempunctata]
MSRIANIWQLKFPKLLEKYLSSPTNFDKFSPACCCYKSFYIHSNLKISNDNRNFNITLLKRHFGDNNGKKTEITPQRDFVNKELKAYIQHNKTRFKSTEKRIKLKGSILLKDFRETKEKMREKVENIIEKENIYTIPNFLCLSRIIISPYLGILIIQSNFCYALGILGVAAVTDLLDGWIARTWKSQSSKIGSVLDPLADKVLVATLFLSLTYADLIPVILTGIIIARDAILVVSAFVIRYKSLPPPKTLSKYFDFTYPTVQVEPTLISKINTGVQLALVGTTLTAPVFQFVGHPFLECLWYLTATTTIASGLSYLFSKNAYKYLKPKK